MIVQTLLLQHCRLFFNFCFYPHNLDHHYILLMSRFFIEKLKFFHNKQNIVHPKKNLEPGFTRGWQETFCFGTAVSNFLLLFRNKKYNLLFVGKKSRNEKWFLIRLGNKLPFSEPETSHFLVSRTNDRMCFLFRNKSRENRDKCFETKVSCQSLCFTLCITQVKISVCVCCEYVVTLL